MKPNYRTKMERKLKRKLLPTEIVHHKDGNQHNDKNSNLQVCLSQANHLKIPKKNYIITTDDVKKLMTVMKTTDYRDFHKALTTFFSNRQIDIILKRFYGQSLSKTEGEMFSRSIKKKLKAIANIQLYNVANQMVVDNA